MSAMTALPPGSEGLALRALSCALHPTLMGSVHSAAAEALGTFLAEEGTLQEAVMRQAPWWQKVLSHRIRCTHIK